MIDIAALSVFFYISETGSLSAAGRLLKMPKATVSRTLVKLEEALGVTLIERSTRHLRLTDAGRLLKQHARRILDDVSEAENAIGGLIGRPTGDLYVDAPFTFAAGPLADMLPSFVSSYPEVRVVLSVTNRVVDVQLERLDVVIRIGPLKDSDLIARRVATFQLLLCASPAYLKGSPNIHVPQDLDRHTLIAHADRQDPWRLTSDSGESASIELVGRHVIPEPATLKTMLIRGSGIGLLPDFHAADAVRAGALERVLPMWSAGAVEAHAVYPSHRSLSAKVRVFVDTLVRHFNVCGTPTDEQ